ncbi:hypothetical protein DHEL01_v212766 [Diaporthe helianthi]|uniref:Uncharacterized protein n=1 Tax=Diaporthe helianthi TaxID=158607 RepID=A0A2P5HF11_DIAHE|nr:hypothetical protein DHEL01_v212766 [Diaporthe helianthi]
MCSPSNTKARLPLLALLVTRGLCQGFTISNGQIFTPGFAVLDSPQPGTPMGGDTIEIALDVTANGILPLDVAADSPSRIHNISIFLSSYSTGRNLTVSNGTVSSNNASLGDIMSQEPGSTVKHVRWTWPACLAGDGEPTASDSDRGNYNISIRQNFVMNNTDFYTIFDVPIAVTNSIPSSITRAQCDALDNPLLTPEQINASAANAAGVLFAPGDSKVVQVKLDNAGSGQGLGGAGGTLSWRSGAEWLYLVNFAMAFAF